MFLKEINAKRFEKIFDQPDQIFQKNVHLSLASFWMTLLSGHIESWGGHLVECAENEKNESKSDSGKKE